MMAHVCPVFVLVSVVVAADLENESDNKSRFAYPPLRRDESVVDDYYGTKVADPYRYLEDLTSADVKNFIKDQNKLTDDYLNRNSVKTQIERKLTELHNYPRYDGPKRHGSRYYSAMNNGLPNRTVHYVQDSLDDEPRVFLDPNTWSDRAANLSDISFSEDGLLVALGLSSSETDLMEVRFRNTSSGIEYPETLRDINFSAIVWGKDGLGIFYEWYPKSETNYSTSSPEPETYYHRNQRLYYHRVGTNQEDDVLSLESDDTKLLIDRFDLTDDGENLILFSRNDRNRMVYFAPLEELLRTGGLKSKLKITAIAEGLYNEYYYVASDGSKIYLQTNHGAPNHRIVAVDVKSPDRSNWSTVVPEQEKHTLEYALNVDHDKIVIQYLVGVNSRLEVRSLIDGRLVQEIDTPVGSIDSIWGKKSHNEFFFRVVSYLSPGIIYRVDLTKVSYKPEVFREIKVPGFDLSAVVTKHVFYPSYDGTLIPMFIVCKQNLIHNGSAGTLLHGDRKLSFDAPELSLSLIVFLQHFDGVYAVPSIRGGISKLREAGKQLNKQTQFDDFHAAAEYLINEGYTTASKLAIFGHANDAILVATCINQRPELYGAGVAEAGVHDLLRYQKFKTAHRWCMVFGCADDGNQTIFESLHRVSPLHNVRMPADRNVQYPSVLLTTDDHDESVVPLHSYKLIAELQYKIGREDRQTNPLMIQIQISAGYGLGKTTSQLISEAADTYAFLVESTGFVFSP